MLDDRMTGPPVSLEVGVSAPHIGTHRAGERGGAVLTGPAPPRLTAALLAAVQPAPFRNTVKCGPNFLLGNFSHGSALFCLYRIRVRFGTFDPDTTDAMVVAKNYIFYTDSDPKLFKNYYVSKL